MTPFQRERGLHGGVRGGDVATLLELIAAERGVLERFHS